MVRYVPYLLPGNTKVGKRLGSHGTACSERAAKINKLSISAGCLSA